VSYNDGGSTGTLALPAVGDVQSGVGYGEDGTEFAGTFDVPAEADVEDGVGYGEDGVEFTGTVTLPAVGDVEETVQYGAAGVEFTGTLGLPAVGEVKLAVGYGEDDTEFEGTYALSTPTTPTLSVVNDGDGDAVTATVAGDDTATHTLYYRQQGASAWTAGESRVGDGEIAQTGLADETVYQFIAIAGDSPYSLPSDPVTILVTDGSNDEAGTISMTLLNGRNTLAASATFQTLVGAADAAEALRFIGYGNPNPPRFWESETVYVLGDFARLEAGEDFIYECTVAGTSDSSEPTWPTTAGATVVDGTATWTARAIFDSPYQGMLRAMRPFALIGAGESMTLDRSAVGNFDATGELVLSIEADVPATYTDRDGEAVLWFVNQLGQVLDDMGAKAGQADDGSGPYLAVTQFKLVHLGRTADEDRLNLGDAMQAEVQLGYRGWA